MWEVDESNVRGEASGEAVAERRREDCHQCRINAWENTPMHFHRDGRDIMTFLHGGDFVSSGSLGDLKWLEGIFKNKCAIKITAIWRI